MLRYLVVNLFIIVGFLQAEIVLPIQKGWTLIGTPQDLDNLSAFNEENVELIWAYDAEAQKWLAYSPNSETAQTLLSKNITALESLKSYQGFWILSSKDWLLTFEKSNKEGKSSKNIELYSGWNLVSLPVDMRISPSLFGSDSVWKYSEVNEWEAFGVDVNDSEVQTLSTISNSNGIWVYSKGYKTIELSQASSILDTFDSNESMINYIREMVLNNQRPYYGCFELGISDTNGIFTVEDTTTDVAVAEDSSAVTDTTTTNIQEEGVDESDIVKHDGNNIFYLSNSEKKILVTSFVNLANSEFTPINSISLLQNAYPNSLYLHNNVLVVIYDSNYIDKNTKTTVEFYDISDVSTITKVKSLVVDGAYINSRLIGEKLYFISSFYPNIQVEYPKIYLDIECKYIVGMGYESNDCYNAYYDYSSDETDAESPKIEGSEVVQLSSEMQRTSLESSEYKRYKYDYTKPAIISEYLVPYLYIEGEANSSMLTPQSFYAPRKLDQRSKITTVLEINVSNQTLNDSISYLGDSSEEYMSQGSLYLVSESYPYYYDFRTFKHRSTIYKFDVNPLRYVGNGVVDGYTLNQFSLSEYNNTLRIATTSGFSWSGSGTNNSVFMLQDINGSFYKVGALEGLGKENETIKAVRFIADKGYVVTFRQIDPFYTLDLSDPSNPLKVGELNVTGFSEYIHPVNDTQLLSIGRDADESGALGGLQLELFDVSDFANPTILDKKVIGNSSYFSEAEYDHRAFTFRDSDSLFGFPYRTYYDYNQNNFAYYTLKDSKINSLGEISVDTDSYYSSWKSRGVFFNYNDKRYVIFFSNGKFNSRKVD